MRRAFASKTSSSLLVLALWSTAAPAWATTDGGSSASVVAVFGEPARYALVAEQEVNEGSTVGFFLVDLKAAAFRRIERRPVEWRAEHEGNDGLTVVQRYIQSLPAELRRDLRTLGKRRIPTTAARVESSGGNPMLRDNYDGTQEFTPPRVTVTIGNDRYVAMMRENASVPSTAAYERETDEPCFGDNGAPRCGNTRRRTREIDGERLTTYETRRPRRPTDCACDARASILRLAVTHESSRRVSLGNRLLVEPYALFQNQENGTYVPASDPDVLDLAAVAVDNKILVFGSVGFDVTMNGTYFPVFAVVRR